ncbi:hypothetical protein DE146DRAFT_674462 [Phaeosphaeria sp. MPI-PUGE-AT-0046c]|nr:hypothetical protein DE146DRAFT_674462 [Phaeosphaeria sp. MPI-PUGE-AT-0046c]
MFILPTTAAVLVAFLALIAYNEIRNRLAKGRPQRRDLEIPSSPTIPVTNDVKPPFEDGYPKLVDHETDSPELRGYKELYYKLHNLEHHPGILPKCRQTLLFLLSLTITDAVKEPDSGILSVPECSRGNLDAFLKAKDNDITKQYEDYLASRKAGGHREIFSDKAEAKWWLKQAAPVKYVDGAWLGHINKASTPFMFRSITKNAWQVMSEELGDGDLAKNHVHVYRELMRDIEAGLPEADSKDFIHPRHGLSEARCWKAALAQLLISLFPHDFLPEALGFNMAYESLPLHLLKTIKELRELRLNPYYFELHVSIDNADSGHAAMAVAAVTDYIDVIKKLDGDKAAHMAWKRVQAGYILAEGLPTTPESPSLKVPAKEPFPRNDTEATIVRIFAAKSAVAHGIHCNSRLRIGRKSLVDWLEPEAFKKPAWQQDFLHDLSNCKPWVLKGDSSNSRLVKELSWEGKMFGSFTQAEVGAVKAWIEDLGKPRSDSTLPCDATAYFAFTMQDDSGTCLPKQDLLLDYPVLSDEPPACSLERPSSQVGNSSIDAPLTGTPNSTNMKELLPLWFASITLLESLPSVPVRAADSFGSALIRVLRAQTGFGIEGPGVAGMDEVRRTDEGQAFGIIDLGIQMCQAAGFEKPKNLRDAVSQGNSQVIAFAEWMAWASLRWLSYRDMLVGMTWAFMEVHEMAASMDQEGSLLDGESRAILSDIATRERTGLDVCRREIEADPARNAEFCKGLGVARRAIETCCTRGEARDG